MSLLYAVFETNFVLLHVAVEKTAEPFFFQINYGFTDFFTTAQQFLKLQDFFSSRKMACVIESLFVQVVCIRRLISVQKVMPYYSRLLTTSQNVRKNHFLKH